MEVEYSKDELKTANISDFILYILKKNYGETKI